MFPPSGAISAAPLYNDPGRFLTGEPSAVRRGDKGTVSLQDRSPLTASLPLQRTSTSAGFQRGVYGNNMIVQQGISDVSSDPNEWSHSWAIRKPKNNQKQQSTTVMVKRRHYAGIKTN